MKDADQSPVAGSEVPYSTQRSRTRRAKGLCWQCYQPAKDGTSMCEKHITKTRERMRKKRGGIKWKPGSRGTPPLEYRQNGKDQAQPENQNQPSKT